MTDIDDRLRRAAQHPPDAAAHATARARLETEIAVAQRGTARRDGHRARRAVLSVAGLACVGLAAVALWPGDDGSRSRDRSALLGADVAAAAVRTCFGEAPAARCLTAVAGVASAQDALAAGKVWFQRDEWTPVSLRFAPPGTGGGAAVARPLPGSKEAFEVHGTGPQRIWLAGDGSGRLDVRGETNLAPASQADRAAWRRAGSPDLDALVGPTGGVSPRVQDAGPGGMEDLLLSGAGFGEALPAANRPSQLPEDPTRLAEALATLAYRQRVRPADRATCPPDLRGCAAPLRRLVESTAGTYVSMLLRWPLTPPSLRAALLRVFAHQDGTRNLGRVRDAKGREGVALQLAGAGADGLNVVLFDPRSSRILADGRVGRSTHGTPRVALAGDTDPPSDRTIRWQTLYALQSGVVDAIGDEPGKPTDTTP